MNLPLDKTLHILMVEAFIRRRFVITTFFVLMAIAVAVGIYWPKNYTSSATIIVDEKNIITPLMHGAAVPTDVVDRARLAREILYSRKIMNQLLDSMNMVPAGSPPMLREQIIEGISRNTAVTNVGTNLIRIEHKAADPEFAHQVTKRLVEFFIAENVGTRTSESKSAFTFIDAQVKEYQAKVARAEENLKQFRTGAMRPRSSDSREPSLQARMDQTQMEIRELETKRAAIERQLAGDLEVNAGRERELRTRLQQQQAQLATLRQSYQDTYPDIVRIKSEVEDLKKQIAAEQKERKATHPNAQVFPDEQSANAYRAQLRQEMATATSQLAGLRARLSESQRMLAADDSTSKRSFGGVTLTELMRDYEVNQNILDDLLKRRENARVSMSLDRDRQGLSFRVHDEASMPTQPSGPLFWHFLLGGLFVALLAPFAYLYVRQQMDSRIRTDFLIRERLNLPVIAVIPHLPTPKEEVAQTRGLQWVGILVFSVVFIIISVIWTGSKV